MIPPGMLDKGSYNKAFREGDTILGVGLLGIFLVAAAVGVFCTLEKNFGPRVPQPPETTLAKTNKQIARTHYQAALDYAWAFPASGRTEADAKAEACSHLKSAKDFMVETGVSYEDIRTSEEEFEAYGKRLGCTPH